jgi:hypothetical protein
MRPYLLPLIAAILLMASSAEAQNKKGSNTPYFGQVNLTSATPQCARAAYEMSRGRLPCWANGRCMGWGQTQRTNACLNQPVGRR